MNVSLSDDVFNLIVRTLNFDTLLSQSQTKQHLEQAGNRTQTLWVKHRDEILPHIRMFWLEGIRPSTQNVKRPIFLKYIPRMTFQLPRLFAHFIFYILCMPKCAFSVLSHFFCQEESCY